MMGQFLPDFGGVGEASNSWRKVDAYAAKSFDAEGSESME